MGAETGCDGFGEGLRWYAKWYATGSEMGCNRKRDGMRWMWDVMTV